MKDQQIKERKERRKKLGKMSKNDKIEIIQESENVAAKRIKTQT